ncbi:hypothetical protein Tco_1318727 [Tanacetum coccineum]
MQSPSLQPPPKSSSQPEGEHIKEGKGKKALSLEKAEKESTGSDSDDENHVTGSMVEPSRTKKLNKFYFITEDGRHIHLTEEEINHQKKLEEDAKAEAAKQEGKRAISRITNCDVLTRKGPITLKVYREDGTSEIIPNFKASTRIDYIQTTEAELGINLDIPLSKQDPLDKLNNLANKKRKHADDIHDYFKANKRLHQGPELDDHARTFSSLLLAEIDMRNLNPLKQMKVLKILGSIFTSVYAAVQKLKKDSWKELQFSLVDNSKLNVVSSKCVEQGMDGNVPDEIDGAKGEHVLNHVVMKGNLEFLVCKEVANPGVNELVDKGRPLKTMRVYAE